MLVDTHCHIHESNYPLDIDDTMRRATQAGVEKMICVGTSPQSSKDAVSFATQYNQYASIGVHPHDSKDGYDVGELIGGKNLVAIGEIGLDYFYTHSPRQVQIRALEAQLQLASDNDLPVIFHVRAAFDDFWSVFNNFPKLRGVLHSYTDSLINLESALGCDLFIGINGISTFTKDDAQRAMFDAIPLHRLLFETDAPFLTPVPHRGKVNEPAFTRVIAEYHAKRREISYNELASATTANATALFAL